MIYIIAGNWSKWQWKVDPSFPNSDPPLFYMIGIHPHWTTHQGKAVFKSFWASVRAVYFFKAFLFRVRMNSNILKIHKNYYSLFVWNITIISDWRKHNNLKVWEYAQALREWLEQKGKHFMMIILLSSENAFFNRFLGQNLSGLFFASPSSSRYRPYSVPQ